MNKSFIPKNIGRRDLIKGLVAAGVIPSVYAERVMAETTAPLRVLFVTLQHGWGLSPISNREISSRSEADFDFPDGLDPLNAIKQHCTVIDGVMTLGEWGNNHDLSYADMLTAGVPYGEKSSDFDSHMPLSISPSLDYLLEESSGKSSFRFCAGYRSWGVQYHPVSFGYNSEILPFFTTANSAYDSIFKDLQVAGTGGSANNSPENRLADELFAYLERTTQIPAGATQKENIKLDRYLTALEHVKNKAAQSVTYSGTEALEAIPAGGQTSLQDLEYYLDMIRVGFANDITTSAVLGIGDIIPIRSFHHDHAHANTDVYWNTRRTYAQHIVNLATALESVVDIDGSSLLDNTLIMLTGEVGDGRHNIFNKGQILIGGSNHIQTGRYIQPELITGRELDNVKREDKNGALRTIKSWSTSASSRTNADLLREIGNLAGLNLTEFGLSSFNRGDILLDT